MSNFSFVLRQPYKVGVTQDLKERKKEKKSINSLLNPNETSIILIVSFSRKHRFKCKTDLKIKPKEWNFNKQEMKVGIIGQQPFNNRLLSLKKNVQTYYYNLMEQNEKISFEQVKQKVQDFVKNDQNPEFEKDGEGFFDIFESFIEASKLDVSHRTIQKYNTLKNSLQEFSKTKKRYKNLCFSDIDLKFYDSYKSYLLTEVKNRRTGEMGLVDDTVSKYIDSLKNFMNWSLDRKHHSNREFQNKKFSSSRKEKLEIVTLKFSELKQLYEYDFSSNLRLEKVRDLFCFSAFTGQRWSDVEAFEKKQIDGDIWTFKANKTGKRTTIPFVGYIKPAYDILEKYNFKLPIITNQKFNLYIKEAAQIAGLNRIIVIERSKGVQKIKIEKPLHQYITMHTGRRTAVSILLNIEKMPIPQVMEITQHSDYDTLKKYIVEDKDALRKNLMSTRNVFDIKMKVLKGAG